MMVDIIKLISTPAYRKCYQQANMMANIIKLISTPAYRQLPTSKYGRKLQDSALKIYSLVGNIKMIW